MSVHDLTLLGLGTREFRYMQNQPDSVKVRAVLHLVTNGGVIRTVELTPEMRDAVQDLRDEVAMDEDLCAA